MAAPLASPPGQESFPRFSPDGRSIAFVGNYDGNTDLYTIGTEGGVPQRVTHHPSSETLVRLDDGRTLAFLHERPGRTAAANSVVRPWRPRRTAAHLPVPYGANGSISADGKWLAYTPHSRDHRTWKRYRGGMATDIWLFHLDNHTSKKITDWEGTDSQPMWHGQTVYYVSDAGPEHRLNIWAYRVDNGERQQITHATDWDVKWPSIGPESGHGEIVYQNGAELYLLDLTRARRHLSPYPSPVTGLAFGLIESTPRTTCRPGTSRRRESGPSFEARGDIWTVPASDGSVRNLTRSSGVAERDPDWSPNGQWIAYFGDSSGEYELYVAQSDGKARAPQANKQRRQISLRPDVVPRLPAHRLHRQIRQVFSARPRQRPDSPLRYRSLVRSITRQLVTRFCLVGLYEGGRQPCVECLAVQPRRRQDAPGDLGHVQRQLASFRPEG